MRSSVGGSRSFAVAAISLVACWSLFFFVYHDPWSQALFITGNAIGAGAILLIVLALRALRRGGAPSAPHDSVPTTRLVTTGIYGLVRHPLYLGWLLAYPAAMAVSQHWVVIAVGAVGIWSTVRIVQAADVALLAKFGTPYERYMQEVPQLNLITGVVRRLIRRSRA